MRGLNPEIHSSHSPISPFLHRNSGCRTDCPYIEYPKMPVPDMTSKSSTIPTPKQTINTPEIRLITRKCPVLIRERTEPIEPQRMIHQSVEPKNTPPTNSDAEKTEFSRYTTPKPGRIATKKMSVNGFAIAIATIDK